MESADQKSGEKRVMDLLISPLEMRGLMRPTGLSVAQFEASKKDLCARLAYMADENLMALEEQAGANPSGKDGDRFPIANNIRKWAADIQPPQGQVSPLMLAVFTAQIGRDAIDGDWGAELLSEVKRHRRFPNAMMITAAQKRAAESKRSLQVIADQEARDVTVEPDRLAWRASREKAQAQCVEISKSKPKNEAGQ